MRKDLIKFMVIYVLINFVVGFIYGFMAALIEQGVCENLLATVQMRLMNAVQSQVDKLHGAQYRWAMQRAYGHK